MLEVIPAVLVDIPVLCVLPDGHQKPRWLSKEERSKFLAELSQDEAQGSSGKKHQLSDVFTSGRV
jgi:hypothetical protein